MIVLIAPDTHLAPGSDFPSVKQVLRVSQLPTELGLRTLIEETVARTRLPFELRSIIGTLIKVIRGRGKHNGASPLPPTERSPDASPLDLDAKERQELERLANKHSAEARLVQRSKIILLAADGSSVQETAEAVLATGKTVRKWRWVYRQRREETPDSTVLERLRDAPRPGRPDRFDEFFWVDVLTMATAAPATYGLPITHWTVRELTEAIIGRKLTKSIHYATVARFLAMCQLQPHRVEQWMNRKEDPEFDDRAEDIKRCLVNATTAPSPGEVTVSFDEKTGVQAKERIAPHQLAKPGRPARVEFEYKRHGTMVLFAMMVIHSGEIHGFTRPNRPNVVTAEVLAGFFETLFKSGYSRIHVVLDQLNTHWSLDLIHAICKLCKLPTPPDEDISTGAQRKAWLSDPDKPIVFHFTPKHASWLNPIEIWFGVLVSKVLRRGNFASKEDLTERIHRFTAYYNERLARPYNFQLHKRAA